jgi:hypothetical protein
MRRDLKLGACLWLSIAGLVACGANLSPVLNIERAPVAPAAAGPHVLQVVHDAIVRALISRTWVVASDEPQSLTASVTRGGHSATVHIVYGSDAYSIHHVQSSPGLKFDGVNIHKRYNQWIDRLRVSIDAELKAVSGPSPGALPVAQPVQSDGPVQP